MAPERRALTPDDVLNTSYEDCEISANGECLKAQHGNYTLRNVFVEDDDVDNDLREDLMLSLTGSNIENVGSDKITFINIRLPREWWGKIFEVLETRRYSSPSDNESDNEDAATKDIDYASGLHSLQLIDCNLPYSLFLPLAQIVQANRFLHKCLRVEFSDVPSSNQEEKDFEEFARACLHAGKTKVVNAQVTFCEHEICLQQLGIFFSNECLFLSDRTSKALADIICGVNCSCNGTFNYLRTNGILTKADSERVIDHLQQLRDSKGCEMNVYIHPHPSTGEEHKRKWINFLVQNAAATKYVDVRSQCFPLEDVGILAPLITAYAPQTDLESFSCDYHEIPPGAQETFVTLRENNPQLSSLHVNCANFAEDPLTRLFRHCEKNTNIHCVRFHGRKFNVTEQAYLASLFKCAHITTYEIYGCGLTAETFRSIMSNASLRNGIKTLAFYDKDGGKDVNGINMYVTAVENNATTLEGIRASDFGFTSLQIMRLLQAAQQFPVLRYLDLSKNAQWTKKVQKKLLQLVAKHAQTLGILDVKNAGLLSETIDGMLASVLRAVNEGKSATVYLDVNGNFISPQGWAIMDKLRQSGQFIHLSPTADNYGPSDASESEDDDDEDEDSTIVIPDAGSVLAQTKTNEAKTLQQQIDVLKAEMARMQLDNTKQDETIATFTQLQQHLIEMNSWRKRLVEHYDGSVNKERAAAAFDTFYGFFMFFFTASMEMIKQDIDRSRDKSARAMITAIFKGIESGIIAGGGVNLVYNPLEMLKTTTDIFIGGVIDQRRKNQILLRRNEIQRNIGGMTDVDAHGISPVLNRFLIRVAISVMLTLFPAKVTDANASDLSEEALAKRDVSDVEAVIKTFISTFVDDKGFSDNMEEKKAARYVWNKTLALDPKVFRHVPTLSKQDINERKALENQIFDEMSMIMGITPTKTDKDLDDLKADIVSGHSWSRKRLFQRLQHKLRY
ncbi:MAG: hypothetical protein ABW189_05060 [Rickettsiales bacterium]